LTKTAEFRGPGGMAINGQYAGDPDDPALVIVEQAGPAPGFWDNLAATLVKAGRHVIRLSSQGNDAHARDALRAVLCQLPVRPVILTLATDAPVAASALGPDAALLATGLVFIEPAPVHPDVLSQIPAGFPVLVLTGLGIEPSNAATQVAAGAAQAEAVEILTEKTSSAGERLEAFTAVLIDFLERRLPRAAPEYRLGSDARTLRDALGCFATGVTIITGNDSTGLPVGLTANSFTSVSLDPPLLLACIAKTAASSEVLRTAGHFAVNVLHIGQQPTSIRFSRRDEDRFGATPWEPGLNGTPVLTGSLATFECARHAVHEGGDHIILIGQVERARFEPRRDPLLYFRGKYRRLHFS
jgi:flavin reductase (DIM6/NTAB) family NADH-FMN oxidoreductase RutF